MIPLLLYYTTRCTSYTTRRTTEPISLTYLLYQRSQNPLIINRSSYGSPIHRTILFLLFPYLWKGNRNLRSRALKYSRVATIISIIPRIAVRVVVHKKLYRRSYGVPGITRRRTIPPLTVSTTTAEVSRCTYTARERTKTIRTEAGSTTRDSHNTPRLNQQGIDILRPGCTDLYCLNSPSYERNVAARVVDQGSLPGVKSKTNKLIPTTENNRVLGVVVRVRSSECSVPSVV